MIDWPHYLTMTYMYKSDYIFAIHNYFVPDCKSYQTQRNILCGGDKHDQFNRPKTFEFNVKEIEVYAIDSK